MTEERLKELERLAMKCPELMDYRPYTYQANEAENAFYRKADPTAVLELIAEIRRLRKEDEC